MSIYIYCFLLKFWGSLPMLHLTVPKTNHDYTCLLIFFLQQKSILLFKLGVTWIARPENKESYENFITMHVF